MGLKAMRLPADRSFLCVALALFLLPRSAFPQSVTPDCNGNGVPDAQDLAAETSGDCNGNGVPDECDVVPALGLRVAAGMAAGLNPRRIRTADLDLDGDLDVAVVDVTSPEINLFLNEGSRRFAPKKSTGRSSSRRALRALRSRSERRSSALRDGDPLRSLTAISGITPDSP